MEWGRKLFYKFVCNSTCTCVCVCVKGGVYAEVVSAGSGTLIDGNTMYYGGKDSETREWKV